MRHPWRIRIENLERCDSWFASQVKFGKKFLSSSEALREENALEPTQHIVKSVPFDIPLSRRTLLNHF